MNSHTIDSLLKGRGAWLKSTHGNTQHALDHAPLSRSIADNYALFEKVRDRIFKSTDDFLRHVEIQPDTLDDAGHALIAEMQKHGMVIREEHNHAICEVKGRRYLSGGWLEELAWLAAMEAGAHEAIYGQVLGWQVKTYTGENEIDLIARRDHKLSFVSCKAFRSELDMTDRKHRSRLMDAVHEADNLADHFGREGESVAVLVTTDLYDEAKNAVRYNALMGKAAVLNVQVIALEDLGWQRLVAAMAGLL
jgi:Holliday junction resolvase-like predicted endonuclease